MNMKNFPKRLDSKTSYLRIIVPENLDLALEGLIRKVLKEQPKTEDIYSFAANYFETLLKIRDKAGAKFIADQLCPFHNDEDAHEMIKLAGTFSKPNAEELRKKNEEFLMSITKNAARNKDPDDKVQDEKNFRTIKSKKILKDEKTVERNKQATSKIIKKLPISIKNIPEEEKKQTKLENKRSDDINLEKSAKKEENDDAEFLVSDPIKELVEKELMETKLSGKKEEKKENTETGMDIPISVDESIINKNIREEQKLVDNNNIHSAMSDANEPLGEENATSKENLVEKDEEIKSTSEAIEETKEQEIKIENNKVIKQASEKSTNDTREENKEKTTDAEESNNEILEKVEEENAKSKEKSYKENTKGILEIDPKSTINLKNLNKEKTEEVEKTNRSTENTKEAKTISDKASDFETSRPLTQETQSEEEINRQSIEMIKEIMDRSSEILKDGTEKDTNEATSGEILDKDNTTDIIHDVKEPEEKNVKTQEDIPPNEIKPQEEESKEFLSDQQTTQVDQQIDTEKVTKFPTETTATDENSESATDNKTIESFVLNIKPSIPEPDAKHNVGKVEVNDNQELKVNQQMMTDDEAERTTKTEATVIRNPKNDEATEVLNKAEELINEDNATQTEQPSKVTEQIKEIQADETEKKQYVLKNDEKLLKTGKATENNKTENTKIQNAKENGAEVLESNTKETKSMSEQEININENIVHIKSEPESVVSQTDLKSNCLKEKPSELSSTDKKSFQNEDKNSETSSPKLLSDPTNPNGVIKPEEKGKPSNGYRVKTTEDTLFGEKTNDLEQIMDNESPQTPEKITVIPQAQKRKTSETQEDQQDVSQNKTESELTNKKSVIQGEENARKPEDELSASLNIMSTNKSDKEKLNEALKSATPDIGETQNKSNKIESEKEPRKEKSDNQKPYFKAEDKSAQIKEDKIEGEELNIEVNTHQTYKEDDTSSEKPNEKSKSKDKFKTISENEEDNLKPEEELCAVIDVQQISNEDAMDRNNLKENYKPEAENTQNKEDKTIMKERTTEEESPQIITVDEADKTEENQEISQLPGEIQIKTIQSHYYNTLQVPETVTKEYRVHNVFSPPVSALLNVEQSHESKHELYYRERIEKTADVNMNLLPFVEKVMNVSSSAEPIEAATSTEDIKLDNLQSAEHPRNSKTAANASNRNEVESVTQKSDSDDLLDLMTPTSSYSLNLSELSWQTVNELFLDSEKRNSSLEKEEIRYVTPKTSKTTGESGEQKATESRQEIEEIIHKTVIPSSVEAVPVPPRDLEPNAQTSENVEEKKEEDKPESESAESSSDSSNGQISINDETPFISVEVKTVIETQTLDDDDDDDEKNHIGNKEQNGEEKVRPDIEIKVETTIDFGNEVGMTQSESEPKKDKMETTDGTWKNSLKTNLENQDKNRLDRPKDSRSTEQTTGGEGSSGESDSTISSAATEIKRGDFAERNFSSSRSLLSTQSLDLERKSPLVKTKSLSTFRHGVTDFEVWSTIEKELEKAATKIQSKFRGYKTRKKLQRENAMQITTEEFSISGSPVEAEIKNGCQQSTGEFHDSIVLSEHPR